MGAAGLGRPRGAGVTGIDVVAPAVGDAVVVELGHRGRVLGSEPVIQEQTVSPEGEPLAVHLGARGFWQAHPAAVPTYVQHVLAELDPRAGERVWDLFSGSGAFTVSLALAVGAWLLLRDSSSSHGAAPAPSSSTSRRRPPSGRPRCSPSAG